VSPDGSKVYVSNEDVSSINIISTATNTVSDTIAVGHNPIGVSVSPDGSKIYVANSQFSSVSVINSATNTVSATITVGSLAYGISISPDGSNVYVTNGDDNTVSVINTAADTVSATITVGNGPSGISVSPDGSKIYVANEQDSSVSVIDAATNTVIDTIAVGSHPVAFGNFITPQNVGIASQSMVEAGIEVFPNPTTGKFQVTSPKSQIQSVEVYNIIGEEVFTTTNNKPLTTNEIDVSSFPAGVYMVKVKTEKGMEVSKFVKE
jgi:YVTN family beta-propeller protein